MSGAYSELNHTEMCACGHLSGGHYYLAEGIGFGNCINCKCAQFRLSVFEPTRLEQSPVEVPINVNQAQVLVTRMFESIMAELEKAEKSREIERQAQQQAFSRLAAIERIIEERIDYVNKANGHDFAALRSMGNEIILRLAKLENRAQPKRKRERKGKK